MAWFKYFKSTENLNLATPNTVYSYPYCKRFIGRFTPRDTINSGTWIFANISDVNINTYKDTSLEDQTDEASYIVTYEKGDNAYPVQTVIEGDYIYFKTYELHTAAEEIVGQYAVYYNTPNLRKLNEVDNAGIDDYQVNLAPVWKSIELDLFVYGRTYDDLISAVGTIYSVSSGALPAGLSINSSTGRITGTVSETGNYSFSIRATTDDGKYYNEASFSGVINEITSWIDNTLANINYNSSYSDSILAYGVPSPTYSISSGALPGGITLNATTGLLSGLTTSSGSYSFTIKAQNLSSSITQSFTGTVQSPPSWSDQALGAITQGVAYSDGVSAAGTATIVYSIYSGSLPTGLSLNSSTGAITGNTGSTGSYSFIIRATNSWGYIEKAFSGTIYTAPAWTDSAIANMIYGQAYSDAVAASGYPAVTYSISAGALPSGITLNSSTGAITGTSTTAGSYSFTVKAENAAGNVTQLFTDDLYVTPAWTDNTLATFTYNTAYSDEVVATGSPTYTISSGTLPTGLSLSPTSLSPTFSIGDTGPGGGKIFITPSTVGNSTGKYFEVAPVAVEVQRTWSTGANQSALVSGADGTAIGTGAQNTIDIVAQSGNVAATSAAVYCSELTYGGYSDWFLPSKDELTQMYVNRVALNAGFSTVVLYWSSTERSTAAAWYQHFNEPNPNPDSKPSTNSVRPVRAFTASAVAVTGTPTYYGAYSFTIQAANETGSVTQSFSGAINRAPTWVDETLADANLSLIYSDGVTAIGYPSVTFSITSGSLPSGLSLNSSTGAVTGTPLSADASTFTITATNTVGSISKSFSLNVNTPPTWNDETLATPTYNTAYSDGVSSNASYSAVTYSISAGSLPSGFSINSSTGAITGTYTTPVNGSSFSYTFTVRAENTAGNVTKEFTWSIAIPFTTSGGTSYDAGAGYTGVYFTANGTFTISTGAKDIEYFALSGGSGGGGAGNNTGLANRGGGGGGAGGNYTSGTRTSSSTGDYVITIGGGGSRGTYVSGSNTGFTYAGTGGSSGGTTSIVYSGSTIVSSSGPSGGSPGGAGAWGASGGNGSSNNHYLGGAGASASGSGIFRAGGGGAGIGGSGEAASLNTRGAGGVALNPTIASTFTVGQGGSGGASTAGTTSTNLGSGGGGTGSGGATASEGRAGVVFLRWLT
jgi:hypothetical protein